MAGVTLSAGVRSNLLSLQSTSDLKELVQGRLSTGKKVNSALDNPNSFFTSSALSNRANDLGNLLDAIGQGVQTLKAADQGISSITKLVESAKAKANQALSTSDLTSRRAYTREYNEILRQTRDIARDSGYNGKNLLGGAFNDLKISFNETNTSSLTIGSVDYTKADALGLTDQNLEILSTTTVTAFRDASVVHVTSLSEKLSNIDINAYSTNEADVYRIGTNEFTATADSTIGDLINFYNQNGVTASLGDGEIKVVNNTTSAIVMEHDSGFGYQTTFTTAASTQLAGLETNADIEAQLEKINAALTTLRDQASTFGTNLQIVQNRQDFTKSFINVLQVGADKLVLADTNEEGANLLALNTRQQLSTTSLSFASQADQAVLQFLR